MLKFIDWFLPEAAKFDSAERSLGRNFVFTHLFGPLLSQPIGVFLYLIDPDPGFACWAIIVCTWLFWLLPFVLKLTGQLQLTALISVELLAFTALFGAFHYGGVSSPFLPWLIISLLLGFFYLHDRPLLVLGMFALNIVTFSAAYLAFGFPTLVPLEELQKVGWISILAAAVYMSWMAVYYASITAKRSEIERETERHRETAQRLQAAKEAADAATHLKSIFVAKMSHELRTPLNAVIGYSEMLLENFEDEGRSESKCADLRRINAAGKHLLALVSDVLDMSRIETQNDSFAITVFDVGWLAEEAVSTAQHLAEENGSRITLNCIGKLGTMQSDSTKVRQVILNLLGNAAKFTTDGSITLAVRREAKPGGDWIEFQVRDTGIGIAPEGLARLFQNFGQATAGISGRYGGTGLGLAISQKLCVLMGGTISVASEPGKGSCFTVRLPALRSTAEARHPEAAQDGAPRAAA
ncbi:ATP-binding protein [Bosea sp. (in: a-proteobacteria)]|uniref:sensor histidine kinase n=1 Tax=Bosea sp. (in: a-proteobacteria) TaxID=1871050 RepID=UPI002635C137|nr:ATP-binding protein [Bosea sp. (in: a-proteobacteria)]MCO5093555.1 ATP-binding protein [Bosea sp. (in: a-proteobacteria)]